MVYRKGGVLVSDITQLAYQYESLLAQGKHARNTAFERDYYRQIFLRSCKRFRQLHRQLKNSRMVGLE